MSDNWIKYSCIILFSFGTYILFNNLIFLLGHLVTTGIESVYLFIKGNLCFYAKSNFRPDYNFLGYYIVIIALKITIPLLLYFIFKNKFPLNYIIPGLLFFDAFGILGFCLLESIDSTILYYSFSTTPFFVASKVITSSFYTFPILFSAIGLLLLFKAANKIRQPLYILVLSFLSIIITVCMLEVFIWIYGVFK